MFLVKVHATRVTDINDVIRWLATAVVQRPELEINRLAFAFHPPPTANLEHV